jgi:SHS2 domain-containing protein
MYETFEHTADLGLRVRSSSLEGLYAEAAEGLFATIVDDLNTVQPRQLVEVHLPANEPDYWLFDWLNELLFRFDTEHLLLSRFEVRCADRQFQGKAWGEALDRSRHQLTHEVKAITYHGLRVWSADGAWHAEVIVDI